MEVWARPRPPVVEHGGVILLVYRKHPPLPYPGEELVTVLEPEVLPERLLVVPRLEVAQV